MNELARALIVSAVAAFASVASAAFVDYRTSPDTTVMRENACREAVLHRLDPEEQNPDAVRIGRSYVDIHGWIRIYADVETPSVQLEAQCAWSDEHHAIVRIFGMEDRDE